MGPNIPLNFVWCDAKLAGKDKKISKIIQHQVIIGNWLFRLNSRCNFILACILNINSENSKAIYYFTLNFEARNMRCLYSIVSSYIKPGQTMFQIHGYNYHFFYSKQLESSLNKFTRAGIQYQRSLSVAIILL